MTGPLPDSGRATARDYRVDFFNTFARNHATYRICQRSVVVRAACCPEHARTIAQLRFAELEGVQDWRIHAAEIEVVPIEMASGGSDTERSAAPARERAAAEENACRRAAVRRRLAGRAPKNV